MSSIEPELQVLYNIGNALVREFPYPHLYVPDVFPADFYREMLRNLPPQSALKNLGELGRVTAGNTYPERGVLPLTPQDLAALEGPQREFWERLRKWLLGQRFGDTMVGKFAPYLAQRFGDLRNIRFDHEALIVRDRTNYALGPHTDSPSKVLSFLFYLPADAARAHLGTSIYVPRDPGFLCQGGPHYDYAKFQRMLTLPYVPNALFAFMKTPNSFHGVEPIAEPEVRRDLLLYDLRVLPPQTQKPAPAAASNIKFTI
jgi:hypothetical protein